MTISVIRNISMMIFKAKVDLETFSFFFTFCELVSSKSSNIPNDKSDLESCKEHQQIEFLIKNMASHNNLSAVLFRKSPKRILLVISQIEKFIKGPKTLQVKIIFIKKLNPTLNKKIRALKTLIFCFQFYSFRARITQIRRVLGQELIYTCPLDLKQASDTTQV